MRDFVPQGGGIGSSFRADASPKETKLLASGNEAASASLGNGAPDPNLLSFDENNVLNGRKGQSPSQSISEAVDGDPLY
jgi:hypothetical protein